MTLHIGSPWYDNISRKISTDHHSPIRTPVSQFSMTICKVGHTIETRRFSLQFKSASQNGVRSQILEEKTDWVAVMNDLSPQFLSW